MAVEGGSKTIDRVGRIMRALEASPRDGMTTAQIAEAAGFDKATTYRAIVSLERIGFIDRDPETRRFRLGVYLFGLAAKTASRFSILTYARDAVARLAEETGDTVFLSVRNKYDAVCIDRLSGNYPIKAQTLSVGETVPLGVSAGGLAILATMNDDEVRRAIQYNAIAIGGFHRVRPQELYDHVRETRRRGYAFYSGHIVAGMGAIACAIKDARGVALAAISIAAILDRLNEQRIALIAKLLEVQAREVEARAALFQDGTLKPADVPLDCGAA